MKYIIDLEALNDCLELLRTPSAINGERTVYLKDVKEMIGKFPKEDLSTYKKQLLDNRPISRL